MFKLASVPGVVYPSELPSKQYFERLIRAVTGQQLSVKAASTIYGRLVDKAGSLTPQNILALSHDQLRAVGLSNAKANYVHDISRAVIEREIVLETLNNLENEHVISELTKLRGIGPWSAEMFLMFTLGRPDVFSFGDLGLQNAIKLHYGEMDQDKQNELVLLWSPYRSFAARALWYSLDNEPKPTA